MGDVAARIEVSRQLVSLVIRNAPGPSAESQEQVLQAAADLGYQPDTRSPDPRRGHQPPPGRAVHHVRQPHDVALVDGIYPAAERLGYAVALGAIGPSRDERKAVEDLLGYRIEALIVVGPYLGQRGLAALAAASGRGDRSAGVDLSGVDSVRTADDRGAQLAIDHLVSLGHRDTVHIDGGHPARRHRSAPRLPRRHAQPGLTDSIRILPATTPKSGARPRANSSPISYRRPCSPATTAAPRTPHRSRAGIDIPGDVSVVGYDDSPIASLSFIDLTTIRQNAEQMAQLAVEAAAERLDDDRVAAGIVLEPTLVVRETTSRR